MSIKNVKRNMIGHGQLGRGEKNTEHVPIVPRRAAWHVASLPLPFSDHRNFRFRISDDFLDVVSVVWNQ
jgi:hypothetical protein